MDLLYAASRKNRWPPPAMFMSVLVRTREAGGHNRYIDAACVVVGSRPPQPLPAAARAHAASTASRKLPMELL
ncbi:hypothetical protein EON66_08545 [archaeon]|nr:MAG: hypothetical protein EON66_08545 [archaeon]